MFQSRAFLSQLPKRFSPTDSGTLRDHYKDKSSVQERDERQTIDRVNAPSNVRVALDERIAVLLNLDHPDGNGLVDERGSRPPAEGVRVEKLRLDDEAALDLEQLANVLVGRLNVDALEVRDLVGVLASLVDRAGRSLLLADNAVGDGDAVVILSKGRRLVNETSSRVGCDVFVRDDSEGAILVLSIKVGDSASDGDRARSILLPL